MALSKHCKREVGAGDIAQWWNTWLASTQEVLHSTPRSGQNKYIKISNLVPGMTSQASNSSTWGTSKEDPIWKPGMAGLCTQPGSVSSIKVSAHENLSYLHLVRYRYVEIHISKALEVGTWKMSALLMVTMTAIEDERMLEGRICMFWEGNDLDEGSGHQNRKANLQHCGERAAGCLGVPYSYNVRHIRLGVVQRWPWRITGKLIGGRSVRKMRWFFTSFVHQ